MIISAARRSSFAPTMCTHSTPVGVGLLSGRLEFGGVGAEAVQQDHPGESATRTMTPHPGYRQDVPYGNNS